MIKAKQWRSICMCVSFGLLLLVSCKNSGGVNSSANHGDSVLLAVYAIPVEDGWGYEIFAGNKLYIKQNRVPQIPGTHHFLTAEDALRAANLVVEKLKQNQSPTIDTSEMQAAGARYK